MVSCSVALLKSATQPQVSSGAGWQRWEMACTLAFTAASWNTLSVAGLSPTSQ